MNRYIEDMLLSCKSIQELNEMKEKIMMIREEEDLISNCNHPLVAFGTKVSSYESYKLFTCIKCGTITEFGYNEIKLGVCIKKDKKYLLFKLLHNLYISLLKQDNNDSLVVREIIDFCDFLTKNEFLKDINNLDLNLVKKIFESSYKIYKEMNKTKEEIKINAKKG